MRLDTQTQNQQPTAPPPPPETQTRVLVPPRQELVGSQDAPSATMGSATTEALGPGRHRLVPQGGEAHAISLSHHTHSGQPQRFIWGEPNLFYAPNLQKSVAAVTGPAIGSVPAADCCL